MKVLIISHNPITTYQSMGKTMLSLFSTFSKDELCQLYIYPTIPDIDVCESYFRITDRNILNSYFHCGRVNSKIIYPEQIKQENRSFFESKKDEKLLNRDKSPLRILARDCMWKFSKWNNKLLKSWLSEQQPDRIFFAPGEAKFIYDIALRISRDLRIPIISYVCDEFYFVKPLKGLGGYIQCAMLKSKIKTLMHSSAHLIAICDELSTAYNKTFSIPSTTVYTGTNYPINDNPIIRKNISGITYLGNLAYHRLDSLLDIGRALEQINNERKSNYKLYIYTRSLSDEQKKKIDLISTIEYCGYVTGIEYDRIIHNADILLHVEAFDEESIDRVKNSISTKIADCLGSGIPFMAYGPKTVASITYLNKYFSELVISEKCDLVHKIVNIFDYSVRKNASDKEIYVANQNHNDIINSKKLHAIFNAEIDRRN